MADSTGKSVGRQWRGLSDILLPLCKPSLGGGCGEGDSTSVFNASLNLMKDCKGKKGTWSSPANGWPRP